MSAVNVRNSENWKLHGYLVFYEANVFFLSSNMFIFFLNKKKNKSVYLLLFVLFTHALMRGDNLSNF